MIPCEYSALDGSVKVLDLDTVFDVVLGYSARRTQWAATIVFNPGSGSFVELRSSPPDYRGNSREEAEEVSDRYVRDTFCLENDQLQAVRNGPDRWVLISRR